MNIVILEDSAPDAALLERALGAELPDARVRLARSREQLVAALAAPTDVILADYTVPGTGALDCLELLASRGLAVPVIVVTGTQGDEAAAECIKRGAVDYLLKDRLSRLGAAVRAAVERARLEKALRASKALYQATFEQAAVGIVHSTVEGDLMMANPAFCALTGHAPEDAIRMNIRDFTPPGDLASSLEGRARILEGTGAPYQRELRLIRSDGTLLWASVTTSLVRGGSGEPLHFVSVVSDISSRKRAESELRELNASLERRVSERTAALEAANRELESFSYSVSHDLRAPLRAISGFTHILRQDYGASLAPDARRLFERIESSAAHLGQLVDDLLQLARASRATLTRRSVDMGTLVTAVLHDLPPEEVGRAAISVGELPGAEGDPVLLRHVWQNLIGNALKFSRNVAAPTIEIGAASSPDAVEYFVRDNGAGFDMRYAHKLFGVFQRIHGQAEFEGTGVGLAIVQRVVRRHGGEVRAEGAPGRGAVFRFTLPRGEARAPKRAGDS
jgi:PAS domain S-box-containing protein